MSKVLVTGANGFVGRYLCEALKKRGHTVFAGVRAAPKGELSAVDDTVVLGDLGSDRRWVSELKGIDVVVHLAARVHMMKDQASDPLAEYRRINVLGTKRLLESAAEAGVRRFIYLSSVKASEVVEDPYGLSKNEAEEAVRQAGKDSRLETVIVRPPLVYGKGVKANFLRLIRWVKKGVPLPLAQVKNRRSMVFAGNLVDAIATCIDHPRAANETFFVTDGPAVSTPELIRKIAGALGTKPRLFPFPQLVLGAGAKCLGMSGVVERLTGSLEVDDSHLRKRLNWKAPYTMEQGLKETVEWYRSAF